MRDILLGLDLIDLAVVGGVGLVLPASLGGRWRWWALAALAVAVSCSLDRGTVPAVVLALAWPAVATAVGVTTLRRLGPPRSWRRAEAVAVLACAWAAAAAGALVLSRAGATPLGQQEPLIQLAAVHFVYASVGALVLAEEALATARAGWPRRLGGWGLGLTAVAPPIVASGFLTGVAVPLVGGAVLMALGVFATAALLLERAARGADPLDVRLLAGVAGLSVWAPMALAVAWAASQHWSVPALSIPDMVRTHGAANAIAFVGAGLLARHRRPPDAGDRRAHRRAGRDQPVTATG